MNETSVTVVGNIASDVTAKQVGAEGHVVVSFRVASSERRWDRASESWVDGDRFSARVSCWRRLGDHVLASLRKGDPVVARGRVSVREYEVGGERRYSTELTASAVGPDLGRVGALLTRTRAGADAPRSIDAARSADDHTIRGDELLPGEQPADTTRGEEPTPVAPGVPVEALVDDTPLDLDDAPGGDQGTGASRGLPAVA